MASRRLVRGLIVIVVLVSCGCTSGSPAQPNISRDDGASKPAGVVGSSSDADVGAGVREVSPGTVAAAVLVPPSSDDEADRIIALIRDLAEIDKPNLGLSPTMSGEGFAPVSWARRMLTGILMNHGLNSSDAFTRLVDAGPAALPYLLESLDDKTPTQLTIEHRDMFGVMRYGQRPAIRWVATEANTIQDLFEQKEDAEIKKRFHVPSEFIALAKDEKLPYLLPMAHNEFNPGNPAEKSVIERARKEFVERRDEMRKTDRFEMPIEEYTVTVGDVCYVIVGQIVNRSYLAVQYQPTACIYIHSPTHDPQIAADVRAIWNSDDAAQTLMASLQADFESSLSEGAVLRLGYYFPRQSEDMLLTLLTEIEVQSKRDGDNQGGRYNPTTMLESLLVARIESVRNRTFEMLQTTENVSYFLSLQRAYGAEHDSLVLDRARHFIDVIPETDGYDWKGIALLELLEHRFPAAARPTFKEFVGSTGTHRRDLIINALWYSSWAAEFLVPLLDDERPLRYTNKNGSRVCDRAAQAICNNEKAVSFDGESSVEKRNRQIERIKQHCLGIGIRKTGTVESKSEEDNP